MTTLTRGRGHGAALGVAVASLVFVAGLLWAKWMPYTGKALKAHAAHHWSGSSVLTVGGVRAGDGPTWHAATTFFHAYMLSIWQALLVALLISASIQALVPRSWLPRVLNRRHVISSALAGGAAGMPSMMCTCCAAPVAVTLRRNGISRVAAVAYWLGNPLLNPAVLVFLFLVAPWQWTLTRAVVGVLTVVAAAAAVAFVSRDREPEEPSERVVVEPHVMARFLQALLRLCLVLLPEYAVMVLVVGALRGWILTWTRLPHGLLVVVLAAVVGTLFVIPTAGEIPILQSLAVLGVSSGTLGALLVTLPAVSVPGAAMVVRTFGWRAVAATAAVVVLGGLLGALLLSVL
jgi:uncharacterized protein